VNAAELQRAWVKQAQLDAERGVIECRLCQRQRGLDEATTLWRNGLLVFALCDRCSQAHEMVFAPTERGVEIRARRRTPTVLGGGP
jgi:hypothetical protein